MNDNGGTAGVKVFNAGMRGQQGQPWLGGIRVPSLLALAGHVIPPGDVTATRRAPRLSCPPSPSSPASN
jgi:hypothetical protein